MAAPSRSQVERWAQFGTEGLAEMSAWLADNPASPFAPAVQDVITTTQGTLDTLLVIAKKLARAELLAEKARIQAMIDAITAEVGT